MGRIQKYMLDVYAKPVCAFNAVKTGVTVFVKHCMVSFDSAIQNIYVTGFTFFCSVICEDEYITP